jgi:hypothetical protein
MKKILLISLFSCFGIIVSQLVFNQDEFIRTANEFREEYFVDSVLGNNTNDYSFVQNSIVKTMTMDEYLLSSYNVSFEKLYSEENIPSSKAFGTAYSSLKVLLNCIKQGACLSDNNIVSQTRPALIKLKKVLNVLSILTVDESHFLDQVDDRDLLSIINLKDQSTSFQSYTLLLRKGNIHFYKVLDHVANFENKEIILFTRNFQNDFLFEDQNHEVNRQKIFTDFVENASLSFSYDLINTFSKISFDQEELKVYLNLFCEKVEGTNTEPSRLLQNSINRLSIQNDIIINC